MPCAPFSSRLVRFWTVGAAPSARRGSARLGGLRGGVADRRGLTVRLAPMPAVYSRPVDAAGADGDGDTAVSPPPPPLSDGRDRWASHGR